jgi:hemerythrin
MPVRPRITWEPEWSTGHQEIDRQHQTLVESLNRLRVAVDEGRGEEELGWCLSFLKAYSRVHFRTEETLMAAYPGYDGSAHTATHERLLNQVDVLFRRFLRGETQLSGTTLETLETWLLDHIQGADQVLLKELSLSELPAKVPQTAK